MNRPGRRELIKADKTQVRTINGKELKQAKTQEELDLRIKQEVKTRAGNYEKAQN